METIRIVKTCLACKHGNLDFGCLGYSELTPGEDPSFFCNKVNFYLHDLRNLDHDLISRADGCPCFEVSAHLDPESS